MDLGIFKGALWMWRSKQMRRLEPGTGGHPDTSLYDQRVIQPANGIFCKADHIVEASGGSDLNALVNRKRC